MDEIKKDLSVNPAPLETPAVIEAAKPQSVGKTFTQEELDNIVVNRLAKERNKYLKKFGVEDETKIDEIISKSAKAEILEKELNVLKNERETLEYKNILNKMNVDENFVDYILTKVEKGEKFAESAKTFVEANPKLLKENFVPVKTNLQLDGSGNEVDPSKMTPAEYKAWRFSKK